MNLSPEKQAFIRDLSEAGMPAGAIAKLMRCHPNAVKALTDVNYLAHMRDVQRRTSRERAAKALRRANTFAAPDDAAAASRERTGGASVPSKPYAGATIETRSDGTRYVTTEYTRHNTRKHSVSLATVSACREPAE